MGNLSSIMEQLYIIKIGGNIVDDEQLLLQFLYGFARLNDHKILVHGGGKMATRLAETMGVEQHLIDGRRITDEATLRIVTMVYAGFINKNIVAQLQGMSVNALGLTGADGNLIKAHKRKKSNPLGESIDYGFVGDVDLVNESFLNQLLQGGIIPIVAPITHDGAGQLLNTNADTIAQTIATSLSKLYSTVLIYSFEKSGVLLNVNDEASVIHKIDSRFYKELKEKQLIYAGMIPKLENAFEAIGNGVKKVIIGKAENLQNLIDGDAGTTIING
jgi:acetylglutamate kinase